MAAEYRRYLEAKRTVDDEALSRDVLWRFVDELPESPTVLEVGAGTVTMPQRLYELGAVESGRWVAVDRHTAALEAGRARLEGHPDGAADVGGDSVRLGSIAVECVTADVFEYAAETDERFDAVVGCAFFDLVDATRAVADLGAVADLVYAPITYDDTTTFTPADPEDDTVLGWYRRHMLEHRSGNPAGATALEEALSVVLTAAPSPWIVTPPYSLDERVVVSSVLETIETAVAETGNDASDWADRRRAQLVAGVLRYAAANRDVLGRP